MKNLPVILLGFGLDPWLMCMARALLENSVKFEMVMINEEQHVMDIDETDCHDFLAKHREIPCRLLRPERLPDFGARAAFVVARGNLSLRQREIVKNAVRHCKRRIVLLRFFPETLKFQVRQILKECGSPFFRGFDEIWTEDARVKLLTSCLRKPTRFFGVFPPQRCLSSQEILQKLIHPPVSGHPRFLFNYAGSENAFRKPTVDWVERHLRPGAGPGEYDFELEGRKSAVVWFNDRPGIGRTRVYDEYLNVLDRSWFTLCLPGLTGITYRVLEAVQRHSIPVLAQETVAFHRLPLENRKNALAFPIDKWQATIGEMTRMSQAELMSMRQNVVKLAAGAGSVRRIFKDLVDHLLGAAMVDRD